MLFNLPFTLMVVVMVMMIIITIIIPVCFIITSSKLQLRGAFKSTLERTFDFFVLLLEEDYDYSTPIT